MKTSASKSLAAALCLSILLTSTHVCASNIVQSTVDLFKHSISYALVYQHNEDVLNRPSCVRLNISLDKKIELFKFYSDMENHRGVERMKREILELRDEIKSYDCDIRPLPKRKEREPSKPSKSKEIKNSQGNNKRIRRLF